MEGLVSAQLKATGTSSTLSDILLICLLVYVSS